MVSQMSLEAQQAPDVIGRQLLENQDILAALQYQHLCRPFRMIVTCARGSSDHAASYGQYLCATELGIPSWSLPPSLGSLYQRSMDLSDCLFLLISQSGQSPDLIASAKWAKSQGAYVVALVNMVESPAAEIADLVFPLWAGVEKSVAATKTFLASLSALGQICAALKKDHDLLSLFHGLPDKLLQAQKWDWQQAVPVIATAENLFILGRGIGFGIAQEAALKLKETCRLHAEAFSPAEVMHGPMALLQSGFPVLAFGQADETEIMMQQQLSALSQKGATLIYAANIADIEASDQKIELPAVRDVAPQIMPLLLIQRFYLLLDQIAQKRGLDPDRPHHLQKVTETL